MSFGAGGSNSMIDDGTAMAEFLDKVTSPSESTTVQGSNTEAPEEKPKSGGGKHILLTGIQAEEHDVNRYMEEYKRVSKLKTPKPTSEAV